MGHCVVDGTCHPEVGGLRAKVAKVSAQQPRRRRVEMEGRKFICFRISRFVPAVFAGNLSPLDEFQGFKNLLKKQTDELAI